MGDGRFEAEPESDLSRKELAEGCANAACVLEMFYNF
jgi:hypothetical protein